MKLLFEKFKSGLQRTKTVLVRNIQSLFIDTKPWSDEQYQQLEATLIGADLGVHVTEELIRRLRDRYERGLIVTSADIVQTMKDEIYALVSDTHAQPLTIAASGPTVIMLVGVNGSGKTTTTGKLAHQWKQDGKSVMLAACDTFRAAAIEQLKVWGHRTGCPVIASEYGADAAAVAYDAVHSAVAKKMDFLLLDTAGRQHTKVGLMDELAKIRRTVGKACPGTPHEVWLVVDGSTGTNAVQQARVFQKSAGTTGLCLTKLDGTSKGGVVVAIHQELKLPVRFVGLGEGVNDLQPFDARMFTDALFEE